MAGQPAGAGGGRGRNRVRGAESGVQVVSGPGAHSGHGHHRGIRWGI